MVRNGQIRVMLGIRASLGFDKRFRVLSFEVEFCLQTSCKMANFHVCREMLFFSVDKTLF